MGLYRIENQLKTAAIAVCFRQIDRRCPRPWQTNSGESWQRFALAIPWLRSTNGREVACGQVPTREAEHGQMGRIFFAQAQETHRKRVTDHGPASCNRRACRACDRNERRTLRGGRGRKWAGNDENGSQGHISSSRQQKRARKKAGNIGTRTRDSFRVNSDC